MYVSKHMIEVRYELFNSGIWGDVEDEELLDMGRRTIKRGRYLCYLLFATL